jgi:hypothetical protein
MLNVDSSALLVTRGHDISLNLLKIHIGHFGLVAIENLGKLFESRALGLDVEEEDEDELEEDPDLMILLVIGNLRYSN